MAWQNSSSYAIEYITYIHHEFFLVSWNFSLEKLLYLFFVVTIAPILYTPHKYHPRHQTQKESLLKLALKVFEELY